MSHSLFSPRFGKRYLTVETASNTGYRERPMAIDLDKVRQAVREAAQDPDRPDGTLKALTAARISLITAAPHIGAASMYLDFQEDPDCTSNGLPTMATDGMHIFYHPDILQGGHISCHRELVAVIAHETYHNMLLHTHVSRRGKPGERDMMIWNYACDYATNAILVDEGFTLGRDWLYRKEFHDLCAEEIYEKLAGMKDKAPGDLRAFVGNARLIDKHMDFAGGQSRAEKQDQKNTMAGSPGTRDDLGEEWKRRLIDAMTQKQIDAMHRENDKQRGAMAGDLTEVINSIKRVRTSVVEKLSNHITRALTDKANWSRPNRRWLATTGQYWPSKINEHLNVGVFLDTSGSVTKEDAAFFLGILDDILSRLPVGKLRYMECDTRITKDLTLEREVYFPEPNRTIRGRGGTDFRMPFARIAEDPGNQPDVVVYLTDGYGPFPEKEPPYPVLWVYNNKDRSNNPPWGDLTRFDRNDAEPFLPSAPDNAPSNSPSP